MVLHGSCLCGGVKYEVDITEEESKATSLCHCRVCRKYTSSTASLNLVVPEPNFKLTSGTLENFSTIHCDEGFELGYTFCGKCACVMYATAPAIAPGTVIVQVGSLDDTGPLEAKPSVELNTVHRPTWVEALQGVEQRKTYAP
ncbi:Mss4-like protein [Paraphoma chrysanthemicola]|nr:Mss4-like protein [Paraphoma chrysanthemicola]